MAILHKIKFFFLGIMTLGTLNGLMNSDKIVIVPEDFFEQDDEKDLDINNINIRDLKPENYDHAMDIRGVPTHLCPCGCNIWSLKAIFNDFEIATYFLDMECASCGTIATAPTPLDREYRG